MHQKHTLPPLATGTPVDLLWIEGDEGVAFGKHRGDWATVTLPATLLRMDSIGVHHDPFDRCGVRAQTRSPCATPIRIANRVVVPTVSEFLDSRANQTAATNSSRHVVQHHLSNATMVPHGLDTS